MASDKRSYFRIDDYLKMTWRPVGSEPTKSPGALEAELEDINDQLNDLIAVVFQSSPAMGEALGFLNRKIDLLVQRDTKDSAMPQTVRVNLSGSGIGFVWHEPAIADSEIDMVLVLEPSGVSVRVRGTVVECSPGRGEDEAFWIRARFNDGQNLTIEQIVKHVNHRQTEMLARERRRKMLSDALQEGRD